MVATAWQNCIVHFSHQLFSLGRQAGMGQTSPPPTPDLSDEVTTLLAFYDFAWPKGLACFAHVGFASVCAFLVANDGNCSAALLCFCPASVVKAARLGLVAFGSLFALQKHHAACQVWIFAEWPFASPSVFDPVQNHRASS